MTVETNPQVVSQHQIEETRRQINVLFDEVGRLSEMDLQPPDYFGEFLKRVIQGLAATAGAVWVRTPQGHLQLQHQINLRQVGLENEQTRQSHDELLRQAFQQARPLHVPPHSSTGQPAQAGAATPGNATPYHILLVPIVVEQAVTGLVEIWQSPDRNPNAFPGFLQFMARMAHLASIYLRNRQLRQIVGQQQLWTQLEVFARQVHGSLNPTEVSYMVVNEGRRLIDCDRVSVGVRYAKKVKIEAISGADVVEKRSNLVVLMRKLLDAVIKWGEKLTYAGTKDDSLPPDVLEALDNYLAESNSKFLVAVPLKDEREEDSKKPPRSALLMECFEPSTSTEQLLARLEVVGRHSTSALYNAVEHKRIPLRFLWHPLARVQEGLGGKTQAILYSVAAALLLLIAAMVFVPYPLKMSATGQLLPAQRQQVFSPVEANVVEFVQGIKPGAPVYKGQPLIRMHDMQLAVKLTELAKTIAGAQGEIDVLSKQLSNQNQTLPPSERARLTYEIEQKRVIVHFKEAELRALRERTHAEPNLSGNFLLTSDLNGTILSWGFQENLTNRYVKPSEPLLRVGNREGPWEIELKIPQKHIGQILKAFNTLQTDELDVDLLVTSAPTRTFKGKLPRSRIAGEATPTKDDPNDSEPMVLAAVYIKDHGIDKDDQIDKELLVAGTEVHTKVRCGNHAMGYSLFYGVWEFFFEKVVFFF